MQLSAQYIFDVSLQAIDPDLGNNSAIAYTISGEDAASFYTAAYSGDLFTRFAVSQNPKKEFTFDVNATDDWGRGHSGRSKVKVFVLSDQERAILVAKLSPTVFEENKGEIIR